MPRFTLKINVLPSISSETPEMCIDNPQNRDRFSKMIDLRGHMLRFTQKMNMFSHLSPQQTPEMCIETLRTRHCFSRDDRFEGSHA